MTHARTLLFGLLGHPVAHSVSPEMQTAALRHLGVDGAYLCFDVPPADLAAAVRGLGLAGARGLNVTVPHKEAVVPLVDRCTDLSERLGAVNTIFRDRDGRLAGDDTDVDGLVAAVRAAGLRPHGDALVLGAGGAAAAAVVALARVGAGRVVVLNRTEKRAHALVERLGASGLCPGVELGAGPLAQAGELVGRAGLVLNATSLGLRGRGRPPVDPARLAAGAAVVDLVYAPGGTPLVRAARRRRHPVVDGLALLVEQGALSCERWTGRRLGPSGREAMRRAAQRALRAARADRG